VCDWFKLPTFRLFFTAVLLSDVEVRVVSPVSLTILLVPKVESRVDVLFPAGGCVEHLLDGIGGLPGGY
jgi:hypothetical protein